LAQFLSMTCAAARLESSVARSTSSCLLASSSKLERPHLEGAVLRAAPRLLGPLGKWAEAALRGEE
jgi:hypothetical protein